MVMITVLSKSDFEDILKRYEIGKYVSHRPARSNDNSVYFLDTSSGKFVLKVHEGVTPGRFVYILRIIEFVSEHALPSAKLIRTKHGRLFVLRNGKRITIQEFAYGKPLDGALPGSEIRNVAHLIGVLDKTLLKLRLRSGLVPKWGDPFRSVIFWDKEINGFDLNGIKHYEDELHDSLRAIKKDKLRKGIIHADLGHNILYKDGKISAITDWDDAHRGYLVYEPAVFIADNFITSDRVMKRDISLFLREYQRYFSLNQEEKKAIYYFIKFRYLNAIPWLARHKKINGAHATLSRYETFSRLSLDRFLGLYG